MANDFSGDSNCKALWSFENGALTTDSKGTNTLTASASSPTADTGDYKEGSACADFELTNSQYFYVTDANLDAGFPLKNGDSTKKISGTCWFKVESVAASQLFGKYDISGSKRSLTVGMTAGGVLTISCGYNGGASGEAVSTGYTLQTGRWYHLGVSVDGIAKTIYANLWDDTAGATVYVGTLDISNELNIEDADFVIGDLQDHNQVYDGKIDELAIFSDLLTSEEIASIKEGVYPTSAYGSDVCIGGTATAISYYSDYTPDKAVDDDTGTVWESGSVPGYPHWWQYEFGSPKQIRRLTVKGGNDTGRSMTEFYLYGSNTGAFGGEETEILHVSGITWIINEKKEWEFPNADHFLYYRIKIIDTSGHTYTIFVEVEMMEEYVAPASGPTQDQLMRHGCWFADGVKKPFWWGR